MNTMQTIKNSRESIAGKEDKDTLADDVIELVQTYYQLTVTKLTRKTTDMTAGVVAVLAFVIVGFFLVLFACLGLSVWLGEKLNNPPAGYWLVGGFFLIVLLILIIGRKKLLIGLVRNMVIRKLYE